MQKQKDSYEEALELKLKNLKECQSSKNTTTCLKCNEIIGCEIRTEYVKAVYSSMNKGEGGDFEF